MIPFYKTLFHKHDSESESRIPCFRPAAQWRVSRLSGTSWQLMQKSAATTHSTERCCSLGEIKAETQASTGCGGCAALLKSVVDFELEERGMEVNTDICEHFPYTRQDLYNLVRVGEIHSFDELIEKHGSGLGCDICKPAVASILASCCWYNSEPSAV